MGRTSPVDAHEQGDPSSRKDGPLLGEHWSSWHLSRSPGTSLHRGLRFREDDFWGMLIGLFEGLSTPTPSHPLEEAGASPANPRNPNTRAGSSPPSRAGRSARVQAGKSSFRDGHPSRAGWIIPARGVAFPDPSRPLPEKLTEGSPGGVPFSVHSPASNRRSIGPEAVR
jgi:hypothetical protein